MATPVMALSELLVAVKKDSAVSPGTTLTSSWVGTNDQGRTSPTVESNRTVISLPSLQGRKEASLAAASSSVHVLAPLPCWVEFAPPPGNISLGTLDIFNNLSHNA